MAKFEVELSYRVCRTVTIEAEDQEAAIEAADIEWEGEGNLGEGEDYVEGTIFIQIV